MRRALLGLGSIAVGAALIAGCGTSDDRAAVREATERFYDAVRQEQGAAACAQISDDTLKQLESQTGESCDRAVTGLGLEGGSVETVVVYVGSAKVDLSTGESAFLSLDAEGWRLSAVACRPASEDPRARPFECEVEA